MTQIAEPVRPVSKSPKIVQNQIFRTLIVDDDEVDRARLMRMAQQAGLRLEADQAASIEEMEPLIAEAAYDLIFLDHNLGAATGIDALHYINARAGQSQALKIMVTGLSDHETVITAMREGCADYLVKEELSVDALRKSIASAVERQILLAALSEARTLQESVEGTVRRFAHASGPEMRTIIFGMLRKIRTVRSKVSDDDGCYGELTSLEKGCTDLAGFLDNLTAAVSDVGSAAPRRLS